jgi:hypothetical protein
MERSLHAFPASPTEGNGLIIHDNKDMVTKDLPKKESRSCKKKEVNAILRISPEGT